MTLTLETPFTPDMLAPYAAGCLTGGFVALVFAVVLLTVARVWAERPRPHTDVRPSSPK